MVDERPGGRQRTRHSHRGAHAHRPGNLHHRPADLWSGSVADHHDATDDATFIARNAPPTLHDATSALHDAAPTTAHRSSDAAQQPAVANGRPDAVDIGSVGQRQRKSLI